MKMNFLNKKSGILLLIFIAMMSLMLASCGGTQEATMPKEVTVQDAFAFYNDGGFILDVRTPEEWAAGHVPGATLIPLDELPNRLSEVPDDVEVYVICRSGNRSSVARDLLLDNDFTLVTSVGGGFNQWVAAGYPYDTGN